MFLRISALGVAALSLVPAAPSFAEVPPETYALFSLLPGAGQGAQGEWGRGAGWFAGVVGLGALSAGLLAQQELAGGTYASQASLDAYFYNCFDAYNLAAKVTPASPLDNFLSAFDVRYLARPAVLIPAVLAATALATGYAETSVFGQTYTEDQRGYANALAFGGSWVFTGFVGTGEEGLFRGFLQHSLSNRLSPWVGIPGASALFALAHTQYTGTASLSVGLFGLYQGIMTHFNNYDLGPAIFLHTLWDALLFTGQWRAGESPTFLMRLPTIPISF